jgi:hypothetical protein
MREGHNGPLTQYEKLTKPSLAEVIRKGKTVVVEGEFNHDNRQYDFAGAKQAEFRHIGGCYLIIAAPTWESAIETSKKRLNKDCHDRIEINYKEEIKARNGVVIESYEPSGD